MDSPVTVLGTLFLSDISMSFSGHLCPATGLSPSPIPVHSSPLFKFYHGSSHVQNSLGLGLSRHIKALQFPFPSLLNPPVEEQDAPA